MKADVACLSETCLEQNSSISFNNFNLIYKARNRQGGGSGILIRKNLSFSAVTNDPMINTCARYNIDVTIVIKPKIKTSRRETLLIISIYNPPGRSSWIPPNLWRDFFLHFSYLGKVIICGDFNGHSPMWSIDCEYPDAEGMRLEMALSMSDLVHINNGSTPHGHLWIIIVKVRSILRLSLRILPLYAIGRPMRTNTEATIFQLLLP